MVWQTPVCSNMEHNETLAKLYEENEEPVGKTYPIGEPCVMPTDVGDVSHVIPFIHSMHAIGATAVIIHIHL